MEEKKKETIESINLKSFNLGELGGGKQLIIDYRKTSESEYLVMTLGNPSPINASLDCKKKELKEKCLENKKFEISAKNTDSNNIRLRFFKLTFKENNQFLVEEYVTPESISEVAKLFV